MFYCEDEKGRVDEFDSEKERSGHMNYYGGTYKTWEKKLRIFLLDDIRDPYGAMFSCGQNREFRNEEWVVATNFNDGKNIIENNLPFDIWYLDNDLGEGVGKDGYDFLKFALDNLSERMPERLFCCSGNPVAKENILCLWHNWLEHVRNQQEKK